MRQRIFDLWGKTTDDERYHPAVYHMLDVAYASQVLISNGGSARVRAVLEHTWQGVNIEALVAWTPFLVALHDIGKISAPFQGQASNANAKRQLDRLITQGFVFPTIKPTKARLPHSSISALFIRDHLGKLESGIASDFKRIMVDAASGHHGVFDGKIQDIWKDLDFIGELEHWHPLRMATYQYLREVLAPKDIPLSAIGTPHRMRAATIGFTGLIILSDWLGSNTNFFPPDCSTPPHEYLENSWCYALEAVAKIGFDAPRQTPEDTNCEALFKPLEPPEKRDQYKSRHLQIAIDQLTSEQLQTPSLYIIEAPTGEGKTEAGLTLERRLAAHGASDEVFFALPTMATSNQMFKRTSKLFDSLYHEKGVVKLAHGQAGLMEHELRRALDLANYYTDTNHDEPSGAYALAWFSGSKKAMLAPFGTGTVDQVELGGLNTRYYMLRLFCLAGKTVIVDEVHAYDTYMNTILDHTLMWLAALGSNVILLSATLPAKRHGELARAFLQGCGETAHDEREPVQAYPVIAHYHHTQPTIIKVKAFRDEQHVHMTWLHDEDAHAQAQRLIDLTAQGGAVARICNRVNNAQAIFAALQELVAPEDEIVLIHAQMPLNQRNDREKDVERLVGKETTRTPNQRIIIVGTQVLEQSLDYDVDVMVSDLAPIDLLLQRAGRLHRHKRDERNAAHSQPILYVQYTSTSAIPDITNWKMIYEPFVLYRTWQVLQRRTNAGTALVTLPKDYRLLIEEVYAPYQPSADDGDLAELLTKADKEAHKEEVKMIDQAKTRLIPSIRSIYDESSITEELEEIFVADEDGGMQGWSTAKTRLGDRITTIPIYQQPHGRYSLDALGAIALPDFNQLDEREKVTAVQTLLKHSLPISSPQLLNKIRQHARWHYWKKTPAALKYLYPLEFTPDGRACQYPNVTLDPLLGLVIRKEDS